MHPVRSMVLALAVLSLPTSPLAAAVPPLPAKPNILYLMADELGYYEPSYMGNVNLQTPNLDRMAAEGIRFTQGMAGSAVCAPTRCCFLTGKHSGHTSVRSNGGGTPLRADEPTIASILKPLGYATGGFGKWGNGGRGSTGVPEHHGFDVFLGYYDQVHAHSYYPPYLVRNSEEVALPGNLGGVSGTNYSHYVIFREAVRFIRENRDKPFLAYLPFTPPHGNFQIPDDDPAWALFRDKPWPEPARRYAAMVNMVDRQLGELLALLRELGIEDRTLVMFSGDNGGADYFPSKAQPKGVHGANKDPRTGVEFRGNKGQLYEGGLRIPVVARWPGHIAPGRVSDLLWYFPDILPTFAELTGARAPADVDGISILPELIGAEAAGHPQARHQYLYWEIGGQTAVRMENWKAIQPGPKAGWELYDLSSDLGESRDVGKAHPDLLTKLRGFAQDAHHPAEEGSFASTELHERDRAAKFGGAPPEPKARPGEGKAQPPPPVKGMLPNAGWKIARASSENIANQKFARNAIDGDPGTVWHTKFTGGVAPPPHELVIDLGDTHRLRGLVYLARQDNSWNGTAMEVEVAVGDDPNRFGPPAAKDTLARTRSPQVLKFPETPGRYVLLRILSDVGGNGFASAAEVGVLGD